VASAILGIAVVAGLTALDVAQISANRVVVQVRDQCLVRVEAEYISAAPYATSTPYPRVSDVTVSPSAVATPGGLTAITVSHGSYSVTVYKAEALSPVVSPSASPRPSPDAAGCPS
jgi:hypothetical protein